MDTVLIYKHVVDINLSIYSLHYHKYWCQILTFMNKKQSVIERKIGSVYYTLILVMHY